MKIHGTIRNTAPDTDEARELSAEGKNYDAALTVLRAQVPEGWQLQFIRPER